jgi:hypothetical protein
MRGLFPAKPMIDFAKAFRHERQLLIGPAL